MVSFLPLCLVRDVGTPDVTLGGDAGGGVHQGFSALFTDTLISQLEVVGWLQTCLRRVLSVVSDAKGH